ncbi:hypothetical protein AGDE_16243 [Angomonas deanei]|uniref:B-box zinc finger containing protein, putative n=1 Tax=Angomonas deanei TaxID=59799 RepID=A0A7G2C8B9_9TRYP|nr:hypothetical protein AGDE_16243 [Angomonas deanei]CAD2216006.1 B-box zinc finger containing protein, putative [Angomonas deanei]|eukprot:EPY17462.1 hypothetical protein AGDE_16243 [Angomonas deanei]
MDKFHYERTQSVPSSRLYRQPSPAASEGSQGQQHHHRSRHSSRQRPHSAPRQRLVPNSSPDSLPLPEPALHRHSVPDNYGMIRSPLRTPNTDALRPSQVRASFVAVSPPDSPRPSLGSNSALSAKPLYTNNMKSGDSKGGQLYTSLLPPSPVRSPRNGVNDSRTARYPAINNQYDNMNEDATRANNTSTERRSGLYTNQLRRPGALLETDNIPSDLRRRPSEPQENRRERPITPRSNGPNTNSTNNRNEGGPYVNSPRSQPAAAPPGILREAPTSLRCGVHTSQLTTLYCATCRELCCPYCASVGHHKGTT